MCVCALYVSRQQYTCSEQEVVPHGEWVNAGQGCGKLQGQWDWEHHDLARLWTENGGFFVPLGSPVKQIYWVHWVKCLKNRKNKVNKHIHTLGRHYLFMKMTCHLLDIFTCTNMHMCSVNHLHTKTFYKINSRIKFWWTTKKKQYTVTLTERFIIQ